MTSDVLVAFEACLPTGERFIYERGELVAIWPNGMGQETRLGVYLPGGGVELVGVAVNLWRHGRHGNVAFQEVTSLAQQCWDLGQKLKAQDARLGVIEEQVGEILSRVKIFPRRG